MPLQAYVVSSRKHSSHGLPKSPDVHPDKSRRYHNNFNSILQMQWSNFVSNSDFMPRPSFHLSKPLLGKSIQTTSIIGMFFSRSISQKAFPRRFSTISHYTLTPPNLVIRGFYLHSWLLLSIKGKERIADPRIAKWGRDSSECRRHIAARSPNYRSVIKNSPTYNKDFTCFLTLTPTYRRAKTLRGQFSSYVAKILCSSRRDLWILWRMRVHSFFKGEYCCE